MKRFLADAVLIFVLITIGNYVKEQEHTQSSVTIEQKVSDFEDDIAQKHTIKQQVETGSLNEIKENGSSSEYKQSSMEAENSVSLMTVHKSKGLGFNTVFYIYKKSSPRKESGLQFNVIMSKDYNKVENYFIINSKYEKILKYLEGQFDYEDYKERKREEEEINNLYVAFTRNKQNFFIIINEKTLKNPPKKIPPFKEVIDKNFLSEDCVGWSNGKFELKELKKETEIFENLHFFSLLFCISTI